MKSSRNLKVGVTLLVIALAVGVFALVVWADGNGMYGMREGSSGDFETPRYGMQNKGAFNQVQTQDCEDRVEGLGDGMGRRADAPDDDGDGIPNGQDADYVHNDCDDECDGTDNISGLQAHVNGMEMKTMSIADIATLWGIDAGELLEGIKTEFEFTQMYNIGSTIDDLRGEYRFSPHQIMEITERIKTEPVE